MNTNPSHEKVASEAEQWFIRTREADCTVADRRDFERWLSESPTNRTAFERTAQLWERLEEAVKRPQIRQLSEAAAPMPIRSTRRWLTWTVVGGLSGVALATAYHMHSQLTTRLPHSAPNVAVTANPTSVSPEPIAPASQTPEAASRPSNVPTNPLATEDPSNAASSAEQGARDNNTPYIIFDHDDIAKTAAQSLLELLNNPLMLDIVNGRSGKRPLIVINGRPRDTAELDAVQLETVERIEILPAPVAAVYGPGAAGGLVNIVVTTTPR